MKTLFLTVDYPPDMNGVASFVYNVASRLLPRDTVVRAPKAPGDKQFDSNNLWTTCRRRSSWLLLPPVMTLALQAKFIAGRYGIGLIHAHRLTPCGLAAHKLHQSRGIPYGLFLYGSDLLPARRNELRGVAGAAQFIVVNSAKARDALLEQTDGVRLPPVVVMYPSPPDAFLNPALSAERAARLKAELALGGKKVVLTVGRLVKGKGHGYVASLLSELLRAVPNIVWIVIGDGPERPAFLEFIQKHNLQGVVRFLSSVPYAQLPAYYRVADVFVLLPRSDEEKNKFTWETVLTEAAASGLPIVTSRHGAADELIEQGVSGVLVDTNQEHGVVKAIVDLLQNDTSAATIGKAARERVRAQFTWDQQLEKLENLPL